MNTESVFRKAKKDVIGLLKLLPIAEKLSSVAVLNNPKKYIEIVSCGTKFSEIVVLSSVNSKVKEDAGELATDTLISALGFNGTREELQKVLEDKLYSSFDEYHENALREVKKQLGTLTGNYSPDSIRQGIYGLYDEISEMIYINADALKNDFMEADLYYAVVETIMHEVGHAVYLGACQEEWYGDNNITIKDQLLRHALAFILPPRQMLKGWDSFTARKYFYDFFNEINHTSSRADNMNVKKQENIAAALLIRKTDVPPSAYSVVSMEEYWAESFSFFLTNNNNAKLLMPNMYQYIERFLVINDGK